MSYVLASRSLPRSLDVQISLSRPVAELRTQLDIMCLAASNLGFLPNANLISFYSTWVALTDDFAAGTEPYMAGEAFFAQTPRSRYFAVGEVFTTAQPAMLVAGALTATEIATVEAVTDG